MQLFTNAEAAAYLRLRERKIYEMVGEGTVPCTKVTARAFWRRIQSNNYPCMQKVSWLESLRAFRDSIWGLLLIFHRARGHLHGCLYADRSRSGERGLCLCRRGVRLSRYEADRCAEGAACLGQYERDDPLHHHQRGAVLVPDDKRADSAGDDCVDQR